MRRKQHIKMGKLILIGVGIIFIIPYGEVTPIENNGEGDKWYQLFVWCYLSIMGM